MSRLFFLVCIFTTCLSLSATELSSLPDGPYSVASTNMEVADGHKDMTDDDIEMF